MHLKISQPIAFCIVCDVREITFDSLLVHLTKITYLQGMQSPDDWHKELLW